MGLNAKNDVFVGAASRLLTQEQTWGQTGGLAHDGDVVCLPRLAVFVQQPEASVARTVPDAFPRPGGGKVKKYQKNISTRTDGRKVRKQEFTNQKESAKTSRPSKEKMGILVLIDPPSPLNIDFQFKNSTSPLEKI